MKENSKRNSGNSLSPLVAHNRVIGTVERAFAADKSAEDYF